MPFLIYFSTFCEPIQKVTQTWFFKKRPREKKDYRSMLQLISSYPPLPSFSTLCLVFAVASRVFGVKPFGIRRWKVNGKRNLLKSDAYSLRNREIRLNKSNSWSKGAQSFSTCPILFTVSLRVFAVEQFGIQRWKAIKGIVSRNWAELEMISMDRSEVFSIARSYFYSFLTTFSCLNL